MAQKPPVCLFRFATSSPPRSKDLITRNVKSFFVLLLILPPVNTSPNTGFELYKWNQGVRFSLFFSHFIYRAHTFWYIHSPFVISLEKSVLYQVLLQC